MEAAEMAASQATPGGAFTEEADEYVSIPTYAEFAGVDLTSLE
jgi:hypothetical protein